jgi:hypothetical protein
MTLRSLRFSASFWFSRSGSSELSLSRAARCGGLRVPKLPKPRKPRARSYTAEDRAKRTAEALSRAGRLRRARIPSWVCVPQYSKRLVLQLIVGPTRGLQRPGQSAKYSTRTVNELKSARLQSDEPKPNEPTPFEATANARKRNIFAN